MKTNPDEQAFAVTGHKFPKENEPNWSYAKKGLTKREYFAAMAMKAFAYDKETPAMDEPTELFYGRVAEASVKMADALIKELNK